ncbi:MAG: Ig-like domain-containing protein [Thermoplasmata archaeon]
MLSRRETCVCLAVILLMAGSLSFGAFANSGGIIGRSQTGCDSGCHTRPVPSAVTVDLIGVPAIYTPGQNYTITITANGGPPTNSGGFDMSVTAGTLAPAPGEANVQIIGGEATQISQLGRSWSVNWTAPPPGTGPVTFYVAALCGNDAGGKNGDDWNTTQATSIELPVNNPPSITIVSPSGTSDWTGGTVHDIVFTASDNEDPSANLLVWLNYSLTGGPPWTPIAAAQAIPGDSSPFSWTLPIVDSTNVVINATVVDTGGLSSWTMSAAFEIDSTPPFVSSTDPTNLESNVLVTTNINATFGEAMNTTSVESAFELRDTSTWTLVLGSFSWLADMVIFDPTTDLNPGTTYQTNISTLAKDDSDPGNALASQFEWTFTTETLNTPPSIVISAPTGGESWSGNSAHDITFIPSDNEDLQADLLVWLNYSTTGTAPWTPIAGAQAIAGDSSPFSWTLPIVDSTNVVINATVVDTGGLSSWTTSAAFEIDSTPPFVVDTSPLDGATGVPLGANTMATWSEPMNQGQTSSSFTLVDNLTWNPILGSISWTGTVFTFDPDILLNPNEWYTANFTTLAMDDSDPGNALSSLYSWSFQTAVFADNEPPSITNVSVDPTPQEVFFPVNISAEVVDNIEVATVSVQIDDPLGGSSTTPMSFDTITGRYYLEQVYSLVGIYDFNISATDTSNNNNWSMGQFEIQDTTPPTITHTPVMIGFVEVPIDITAIVWDNYMLSPTDPVWLNYTDVVGTIFNVSMIPTGGDNYSYQIPAQTSEGTVSYFIWAIDSEGNDAKTATYTIAILAVDVEPPEITNVLADPSPQEVFNSVNITATITDSSGVASASVEITWPDSSVTNQTMDYASSDVYYLEQTYNMIGTYSFTIWANDTNDFWNSSFGTFEIQDTTPPSISHTPITSGTTGVAIDISATVNDSYQLSDVRINYVDVDLNAFNESMTWTGGDSYVYQIPAQTSAGVVTYFIWAVDSSGNAVMTSQYDITISLAPDNEPPVADAGPDQLNNPEGTEIQFNGTGSTDNVGIVSYRWTFAYGPNEITLEGAMPSFILTEVGEYTVTLNVADAAGLSDTDTMIVSIVDSTPPEVIVVSPLDSATDISTKTDYVIVFSEAMDTAATQQAISIEGVNIESYDWSNDNTKLTLTLSGLKEGEEYTVAISGDATDVAGNALTAQTFTFTTMEVPSPPFFSLEQDWLWIVIIIVLIVIIVILVLMKTRPLAVTEEPEVFEPVEPQPVLPPEEFPPEAEVPSEVPTQEELETHQ